MKTAVLVMAAACVAGSARAEDLLQVYRDAQRYDAQYSAARYALEAGREKLPQGRAFLLPTLGLTGKYTPPRNDSSTPDPAGAAGFLPSSRGLGYPPAFTTPVFR